MDGTVPIRLIAKEDECRDGETIRSMASRGVLGVRSPSSVHAAAKIGRWGVAPVFLAINRIGRDGTTYRRLRNNFEFEPPHSMHLKGKGETTVYRLVGRKSANSAVARD